MKKLFTLIAAALMTIGASAQKTNLSLAAGWDTSIEVDLTGDVEFNFKNSYACIYMDITEVDLATYPSYEIVVSEDTPVTNLQLYVKSDAGENWSGSFSAGTTVCSFVPETATKILAIGLQACNVANLGKVEIVSASLIDKDGNKKALSYKMPESWAADVVTPVTNGNIVFTSGGQWTAANLKGGEDMALPVKITFNADEFPANVQLQIITSKADESTYSKNREVSSELTAGEKTHTVTIEALEEGETIKSIAVQNKEKQDPFKIMNVTATIEPAGGETPATPTTLIDYPTKDATAENGITLGSEVSVGTFKIHTNTDAVSGFKFAGGYTADGVIKAATTAVLSVDGGFKKGDKIQIAGAFNNSSDSKQAGVQIFTGAAGEAATVLWTSELFINGRLVADDPAVQEYTLEADAATLNLGRSNGLSSATATWVTLLKVVRETATGIQEIPVKVINNGAIYNLAGQKVNESYKGIVIKNGKKYIQK